MRSVLKAALFILVASIPAVAAAESDPPRTISVGGEGMLTVLPDMATVLIGVQAEAVTAAEAMDQASSSTAAILDSLAALNVEPKDIQSNQIQLMPRYAQTMLGGIDYAKIEGYSAVNEISVKLRDLTAMGGVLSKVIGEGANRLNGVNFGLQEPEIAMDQVRILAVVEARRRAELYAEAAGVKLGDLLQLSDNGTSGVPMYRMEPIAMEASISGAPQFDVPVAPGELTLHSNVAIVFEIAE